MTRGREAALLATTFHGKGEGLTDFRKVQNLFLETGLQIEMEDVENWCSRIGYHEGEFMQWNQLYELLLLLREDCEKQKTDPNQSLLAAYKVLSKTNENSSEALTRICNDFAIDVDFGRLGEGDNGKVTFNDFSNFLTTLPSEDKRQDGVCPQTFFPPTTSNTAIGNSQQYPTSNHTHSTRLSRTPHAQRRTSKLILNNNWPVVGITSGGEFTSFPMVATDEEPLSPASPFLAAEICDRETKSNTETPQSLSFHEAEEGVRKKKPNKSIFQPDTNPSMASVIRQRSELIKTFQSGGCLTEPQKDSSWHVNFDFIDEGSSNSSVSYPVADDEHVSFSCSSSADSRYARPSLEPSKSVFSLPSESESDSCLDSLQNIMCHKVNHAVHSVRMKKSHCQGIDHDEKMSHRPRSASQTRIRKPHPQEKRRIYKATESLVRSEEVSSLKKKLVSKMRYLITNNDPSDSWLLNSVSCLKHQFSAAYGQPAAFETLKLSGKQPVGKHPSQRSRRGSSCFKNRKWPKDITTATGSRRRKNRKIKTFDPQLEAEMPPPPNIPTTTTDTNPQQLIQRLDPSKCGFIEISQLLGHISQHCISSFTTSQLAFLQELKTPSISKSDIIKGNPDRHTTEMIFSILSEFDEVRFSDLNLLSKSQKFNSKVNKYIKQCCQSLQHITLKMFLRSGAQRQLFDEISNDGNTTTISILKSMLSNARNPLVNSLSELEISYLHLMCDPVVDFDSHPTFNAFENFLDCCFEPEKEVISAIKLSNLIKIFFELTKNQLKRLGDVCTEPDKDVEWSEFSCGCEIDDGLISFFESLRTHSKKTISLNELSIKLENHQNTALNKNQLIHLKSLSKRTVVWSDIACSQYGDDFFKNFFKLFSEGQDESISVNRLRRLVDSFSSLSEEQLSYLKSFTVVFEDVISWNAISKSFPDSDLNFKTFFNCLDPNNRGYILSSELTNVMSQTFCNNPLPLSYQPPVVLNGLLQLCIGKSSKQTVSCESIRSLILNSSSSTIKSTRYGSEPDPVPSNLQNNKTRGRSLTVSPGVVRGLFEELAVGGIVTVGAVAKALDKQTSGSSIRSLTGVELSRLHILCSSIPHSTPLEVLEFEDILSSSTRRRHPIVTSVFTSLDVIKEGRVGTKTISDYITRGALHRLTELEKVRLCLHCSLYQQNSYTSASQFRSICDGTLRYCRDSVDWGCLSQSMSSVQPPSTTWSEAAEETQEQIIESLKYCPSIGPVRRRKPLRNF